MGIPEFNEEREDSLFVTDWLDKLEIVGEIFKWNGQEKLIVVMSKLI